MAELTELDKLKARLSITDDKQDVKLSVLLADATSEALNYCNRDDVVEGMKPTIRQIAYLSYLSEGSELYSSESEGGRSVSYKTGDDLPTNVKKNLNRFRIAKVSRL